MTAQLLPDSKLGDTRPVSLYVFFRQLIKQTPAAPDHLEQAKLAVLVFLVDFEMFGELFDALREDGDLYFRRAGVRFVGTIVFDNSVFLLFCDHSVFINPFFSSGRENAAVWRWAQTQPI